MANGWGGARPGGGRPKLAPEDKRKKWQMYAHPDEWEAIKRFAKLLKHGDKEACLRAVGRLEAEAAKQSATE